LIAYPHGAVDHRATAAAAAAGFIHGFEVGQKPARPGSHPLRLGRVAPSRRSRGHFALQLSAVLLGRSKGISDSLRIVSRAPPSADELANG
jgi:hypothetical protein